MRTFWTSRTVLSGLLALSVLAGVAGKALANDYDDQRRMDERNVEQKRGS